MITLTTRQKLFIARSLQQVVLALRQAAGRGAEVDTIRRSIHWRLDLREGIDFAIWLLGAFEPETVSCYRALVKPGDVVLDIGANIGAHTLHLAKAVGERGQVLAFEPTDYAFGKLRHNLSLNPQLERRVAALQVMLLDHSQAHEPPPVYSSWPLAPRTEAVHPQHGGRLERCSGARAATLDQTLRDQSVERVDLIKIDIDGFETLMLRGAVETLARFHPVLVMELAPYVLEERGSSLTELLDILGAAGYGIGDVATGRPLPLDEHILHRLIPRGGGRNIVARPLR